MNEAGMLFCLAWFLIALVHVEVRNVKDDVRVLKETLRETEKKVRGLERAEREEGCR